MQSLLPIATANEMQEMDVQCMQELNISSIELMQRAAFAFYTKLLQDEIFININKITILCGKGNNGGDGYALALLFVQDSFEVSIIEFEKEKKKSFDCEHYFLECKKNKNIRFLQSFENVEEIDAELSQCDLLIDAVYGTQFRDCFSPQVEILFEKIQTLATKAKKVAVDIPSGLCADKATLCKAAFKADLTISFEMHKCALLAYPACENAGRVELVDIGFTREVRKKKTKAFYIISDTDIMQREINTHKGNYGKTLMLCASETMLGAGYFAAMGALRFGLGLLYFACPHSLMPLMQMKINEAVFLPYNKEDIHSLEHLFTKNNYSSLVHGCGFGTDTESQMITKYIIENSQVPLVLDADALTNIAHNPELLAVLKEASIPLILTPHEQEMARLIAKNAQYVKKNRLEVARDFAIEHNVYLILKGARSIIACPDSEIFINSTGNAGMAKGGSGDILAGMLAASLARTLKNQIDECVYNAADIKKALCSAVYNHGLAGDRTAAIKGQRAMLPTDMLDYIY